jgi:hypothetical protein
VKIKKQDPIMRLTTFGAKEEKQKKTPARALEREGKEE